MLRSDSDIRILIGGDVFPGHRNEPYFRYGDAATLLADFESYFRSADLAIVNLEGPFVRTPDEARKAGPVLGAHPDCVAGFVNARIGCVGLANNHISDHGAVGIATTLSVCDENGMHAIGGGMCLEEARRPYIHSVNGYRIGIIAAAEREFGMASDNIPGANPLDLTNLVPDILSLARQADYPIVLLHAGPEDYPYPTPRLQRICHLLIELGARCVVCQHSHCAGCWEAYHDGLIVYGQGNLLFDWPHASSAEWHKGFLVALTISVQSSAHFMEPIPYLQSFNGAGLHRLPCDEEKSFIALLTHRSDLLTSTPGFVRTEWDSYCRDHDTSYLSMLLASNRYTQSIVRRCRLDKLVFNARQRLLLLNLIRCGIHREILETILDPGWTHK